MSTEDGIVQLVERLGPLTGAELQAQLSARGPTSQTEAPDEAFSCWKAAMLSSRLAVRKVGTRFLRLDRKVDGFARLSPSILREFLTYSVVGLTDDTALDRKAAEVLAHIRAVSRAKLDLASRVVAGVATRVADGQAPEERFCVFIAGDVVYDMAHDVPRPERSTGTMVRGSDLDLVVVVDDAAPEALLQQLDQAIYQQKYRHLINPSAREEIDYIVKRFRRLREQTGFDTFQKMVACKILQEGVLLHGSRALFDAAKALLSEHAVTQKLAAMDVGAAALRRHAEQHLLDTDKGILTGDDLHLFYTADESEEFE